MRIASRRYPYRPLGRGSPRPTPARYVGLCGGDGPPPRLSGGYTRPAHVLGYSNAPSPRGGPTRAAGLWCARSESLGDGRRKVGVIARVSGADAIYGAGRARPLRGRAEVSLGSRLPPGGRAVGASVGRIKQRARLSFFVLFCFVEVFLFFEFLEVLSFLSFLSFLSLGGTGRPLGARRHLESMIPCSRRR